MSCTPQGRVSTNSGFCEPQSGETNWSQAVNGNFDILDGYFAASGLSAGSTPALLPQYGGLGGNVASPTKGAVPVANGTTFNVATTNTIQVQGITANVMSAGVMTVNAMSVGAITTSTLLVGVSSGTTLTQISIYTAIYTPTGVASASVASQTFVMTGLATSDKIVLNPPLQTTKCVPVSWRVNAADTLEVYFMNPTTAGVQTSSSGTFTVIAIRS